MGSFCFSKSFFLILVTLAMISIEKSLAFKCYACDITDFSCHQYEYECPDPDHDLCIATYASDGGKSKRCASKKCSDERGLLQGADKCKEAIADDFFTEMWRDSYKRAAAADPRIAKLISDYGMSEHDIIELLKKVGNDEIPGTSKITGYDPNTKVKICYCDKELCNDDEFDKKNMKSGTIFKSAKSSLKSEL